MAASNTHDFSDFAMLELFRAEVESHTQALNEGLLALEKDPGQHKLLESLMRAAHSIKGAARIVGVEDGVRLSHGMEDCLVAAQNGQIVLNSEAIDILLRGVDAIVRIANSDRASVPGEAIGVGPPNMSPPDAAALERLLQEIASIRQGKPRAAKKPTLTPETVSLSPEPAPSASRTPTIAVVVDGNLRTLCLSGNLDAVAAEQLRVVLVEQLDAGGRDFRLDLAAVREVGVEGLALLTVFARMVREKVRQAALDLINVGQDVLVLFRKTGLAALYRVDGGGS
jgi:chemotaxis protein histidine kinase CheA